MTMAVRQLSRSVSCLSSVLESTMCTNKLGPRNISTGCGLCGKKKFIDQGIDINKYTLRPLPLTKSGGRNFTGQITVHGVGGGAKQRYRMVDFKRLGPKDGSFLEERVMSVRYDPCRTSDIAVVAGGTHKRYILASETMKPGIIIKTSSKITQIAVRGEEGDAYPVGSLPVGTLVHNLEVLPTNGGKVARAAGTCAQLLRKVGDRCILRMPSKREVNVSSQCMATIGRVSNIDHDKEIIGSAGRARWFGIRPQSGLWHRKTGYNGRKIRPMKPAKVHSKAPPPVKSFYRFTM